MFINFYPLKKSQYQGECRDYKQKVNILQSFKFSYFKSRVRKMMAISHVFNNALANFI